MSELQAVPLYCAWPDQALYLSCGHTRVVDTRTWGLLGVAPGRLVGRNIDCEMCERIHGVPMAYSKIVRTASVTLWP